MPKPLFFGFYVKYVGIILFIGFLVFFALASSYAFASATNIRSLLKLIPEFSIVAIGVGVLMIAGEIDLSVSSTIPICGYVFSLLFVAGVNVILIVSAVLSLGLFIGLLNGLVTVKGRIPSFITTLGSMMLLRGILYAHSGMLTIAMRRYLVNEPLLVRLFIGEVAGVPVQFLWLTLFALMLGIVLHFHRFGCWIYATGGNKEAARAMGIKTDMVKTICFMLVGFLCAFSAIMQIIRVEAFHVVLGNLYELQAIAACVMGGASLFGGIGGLPGFVWGSAIIPMIQNGIVFLPIPAAGTTAFVGIVIVFFALLNTFIERKIIRK